MKYSQSRCPLVTYIFSVTVPAQSIEDGRKNVLPIVKQCEDFAEGLHVLFRADHFCAYDGILPVRLIFQIQESEESILLKVPAIFSLAASLKLSFINQTYDTK